MLAFAARLLGASDKTDNGLTSPAWRGRNFCSDLVPFAPDGDSRYDAVKGDAFKADQCYFSVRIAEMRLAEAGNYIATYLPMCSCFLRYSYGNALREVPFIISYEDIRRELKKATGEDGAQEVSSRGAQHVEFTNLYIVRDAPLKADGLVMYTALCRMADTTFARGMLDFIVDAAGTFGGAAAGLVARSGADMTKRLGKLLGADGVTTRFGIYDGSALQRSGYRVFAGANALQGTELLMDRGQLKQRNANGETLTIDDVDYMLVAFEYRKSMCDEAFSINSSMPFNTIWVEVTSKLIDGGSVAAQEPLKRLMKAIAASSDLIEPDRLTMIRAYLEEYERWKKQVGGAETTRAAGEGSGFLTNLSNASTAKTLPPKVGALLRDTASRIGAKDKSPQTGDIKVLSAEALTTRAQVIRARLDQGDTDTESLAEASARVAAVALASPL